MATRRIGQGVRAEGAEDPLLSSEAVLRVLKPKLIDEIQGPVSIPTSASSMPGEIYGIMQLLHKAVFVTEMFYVKTVGVRLRSGHPRMPIALREADPSHRQSQ